MNDREMRARLRRFRIAIAASSLAVSVLLVAALVRFGVVPAGPFRWIIPGSDETVAYPVERGALVLEEPGAEKTGHRYLFDDVLGWRNIPNWKSTTFGRELTINSKGLRGREYPYEKPPGVKRILILGDSFAWGYAVADDEVFTEQLETLLKGRARKWEVINTGVSGWSTDQQYLHLREEGLKYSPDIVLLAFCSANDIKGCMSSRIYALNKPLLNAGPETFGGDRTRLAFVNPPPPKPGDARPAVELSGESRSVMEALLGGICDLAQANGAEFATASFGRFMNPSNAAYKEHSREARDIVRKLSGAIYFDIDLAFWDRSLALSDLADDSIEHDGHWDAEGHRLVAEILEEFLRLNGVLDRVESGGGKPAPATR